ncbi:Nn.00g020000.m01.CDS01 [Neocucurbitaria sp. VM-36]
MDEPKDILQAAHERALGQPAILFIFVALVVVLYKLLTRTDVPYIRGIPEIPGALPITGHLTQLGDDHATVCEQWWRKYGNPVFQIRLGNTRAVIVSSFDDCKKILVSNSQGLIDRPKLFTLHGLISSTQGFTIGSSPWDESCRNKRKAASTTLSKGMMKNYYNMFDLESYCIVRDLNRDKLRERRDKYLNEFLNKVREMIKKGTEKPCISAAILKDEETRLTGVEVSSICLSLVSDGFEIIPGTLVSCIGSLSTPQGQKYQKRAYQETKKIYPDITKAWATEFVKERVPYLNAIVKEAGRYYTVSNMSLPRKTMSDVRWGEATIPKGTMVLINAQAGNHNIDYWGPDAATFNPERWLDPPSTQSDPSSLHTEKPTSNTPHLSFGAGSRSCPGATIAGRLINAALFRLTSLYKIEASATDPPNTDYVDYNAIKSALVAIPRDFKVKLTPRDGTGDLARLVLKTGEERTRDFYKE